MALILFGIADAQTPARYVELVDTLVAQVAVAVIPEPVPVVVKAILGEVVLGCGPSQSEMASMDLFPRALCRFPVAGRLLSVFFSNV